MDMNSASAAPLPSAELMMPSSEDDFHLDCFKSYEDSDNFMDLCSVADETFSPYDSSYSPNGVHSCIFCGRSFTYVDVHMNSCRNPKFLENGKMIKKLREKIDDLLKTKEQIYALRILLDEKKLEDPVEKKYSDILKKLGKI